MHGSSLPGRLVGLLVAGSLALGAASADEPHPLLTWVKRHPQEKSEGKPPPRMGYETSYGYDSLSKLLVRYGGHNQGGGGEQNSEVWTYDLDQDVWTFKEPNDAPPGVCCAQQNVFDDALRKLIRFPAFSGNHGWQSPREIYLRNSSVWTYDPDTNTWGNMRPFPEVWPSPLRGAAYDPHHRVVVLHGGEGSRHGTVVYDLFTNTWNEMKPDPAPPAGISQPGFAYDEVHRVFVLFGSQFQDGPRTWTYDLRENRWRVLEVDRHPPADKSSPVLAADTRNGIVLCSVRGADGLETWALDVAKRSWTRLNVGREPDPSGNRNRVLLYLADRNLFVLENRVKEEQQIWTFRYAEAPPPPGRVQNLRVTTEPGGAALSWEPPPGEKDLTYTIYRGQGAKPWGVEWEPIAEDVRTLKFSDAGLRPGSLCFYQVGGVRPDGAATAPSWPAGTQPPVVPDLCVSVLSPTRVEVQWPKSPGQDVAGYHVERAGVVAYSTDEVLRIKQRYRQTSELAVGRIQAVGRFQRLTEQPLEVTSFVDETVDLASGRKTPDDALPVGPPVRPDQLDPQGKPYRYAICAYRVIAVNRLGVESGPSPMRFTYPSAVQHVFAQEKSSERARLKWQPNPEKAVRGYLIYRQDGRWDKDPIVRLTPEPITATEFLDDGAGESTRRYEVVAVDALGQEGEPSRPVWSRREWQRFYLPYTGPWHQ